MTDEYKKVQTINVRISYTSLRKTGPIAYVYQQHIRVEVMEILEHSHLEWLNEPYPPLDRSVNYFTSK
jgi:hypothetical protein